MAAAALGLPVPAVAELEREVTVGWPLEKVDVGLVEGAGGVASPQANDGDTADLARALAVDLALLVAEPGLGTINSVRLCLEALAPLRIIVHLNRFDPRHDVQVRNRDWLRERDGLEVTTDIPESAPAAIAHSICSDDWHPGPLRPPHRDRLLVCPARCHRHLGGDGSRRRGRGHRPAAEAAARTGCWVAGYVAYEAAPAFDPSLTVRASEPGLPLAWFGVSAERYEVPPIPRPASGRSNPPWRLAWTPARHRRAVAEIKVWPRGRPIRSTSRAGPSCHRRAPRVVREHGARSGRRLQRLFGDQKPTPWSAPSPELFLWLQ